MVTKIVLDGNVIPKGRPRFTKRGHVYTPKKTADYEKYVKLIAMQEFKEPYEKPVRVQIIIKKKPPKSWSKKKRKEAIDGVIAATAKPDIDNYGKSILDGMNGIAWIDDSYVVELTQRKEYAEKDEAIVYVYEEEYLKTAY